MIGLRKVPPLEVSCGQPALDVEGLSNPLSVGRDDQFCITAPFPSDELLRRFNALLLDAAIMSKQRFFKLLRIQHLPQNLMMHSSRSVGET